MCAVCRCGVPYGASPAMTTSITIVNKAPYKVNINQVTPCVKGHQGTIATLLPGDQAVITTVSEWGRRGECVEQGGMVNVRVHRTSWLWPPRRRAIRLTFGLAARAGWTLSPSFGSVLGHCSTCASACYCVLRFTAATRPELPRLHRLRHSVPELRRVRVLSCRERVRVAEKYIPMTPTPASDGAPYKTSGAGLFPTLTCIHWRSRAHTPTRTHTRAHPLTRADALTHTGMFLRAHGRTPTYLVRTH